MRYFSIIDGLTPFLGRFVLLPLLCFMTTLCGVDEEHYELTASMEIEAMPLSALLPVDFPLKGMASGRAQLTGDSRNPRIELTLHVDNLIAESASNETTPPASADLTLTFDAGQLSCSGTIIAAGNPSIDFHLQASAKFSLFPFALTMDPKAPITGHLSANGEITYLIQLVSDSKVLLSGLADVVVTVTGTLSTPKIHGVCNIVNGRYEIPEIGAVLSGLTAHIEGSGEELKIMELYAIDESGGTVTGAGVMTLDIEKKFPFSLNLFLNQAALLNQDYATAVCSGPLTFHGNATAGFLDGEIVLNSGEIVIPDQSPTTVQSVEVVYVNIPYNAPSPQPLRTKRSDWPLSMGIRLSIPDNLSIQGRDLSSLWRGNLTIQGEADALNVTGQLRIVQGEYLFNGNPFAISQGTITFAGDIDKKTTIYVIAGKDLDRVQVDVIAKGPAKNPTISFRSNPPLPQREILSWILFNRGSSEISQFQGTQLSESITNLKTGQQEGPDVLTKIRTTLGVDRFEICRSSKNDSSNVDVQIGKYISEGVLISVIKSEVNRIAVEADITERIKLQAQVGDDTEGQMLLKWKRNY